MDSHSCQKKGTGSTRSSSERDFLPHTLSRFENIRPFNRLGETRMCVFLLEYHEKLPLASSR